MYKLLIVEDEAIIRRGLMQAIPWGDMGFTVIGDAADGKKALKQIEAALPDIILTDIQMPIMNGLELMSAVNQQYPSVRLVVLSGYSDFSYAQHAIECGALAYILKPTKEEEIRVAFLRAKAVLDGSTPVPVPDAPCPIPEDPVIARVAQYIQKNFSEKISLEDVAGIAYMNPTYFSTYFKRKTGQSFKDYLVDIRMQQAKKLVLGSDLKSYHIAVMVGYDDARHFAKLFRETFGQTVGEMRNSQGK